MNNKESAGLHYVGEVMQEFESCSVIHESGRRAVLLEKAAGTMGAMVRNASSIKARREIERAADSFGLSGLHAFTAAKWG